MVEDGATHVGVATDHVIESFRNGMWPGYKTGAGIEPALRAQFHPLEDALAAMGVAVWPMVELEADDALASAAHLADNGCERREDRDLDAGQGPRAMRSRRSCRADRSQKQEDPRRGGRAREIRCSAGADSRLPRARGRCGRRLSRHPGHRRRHGGAASEQVRPDREACPTRSCATTATTPCSSRISRRCEPMRRSLATSMCCIGRGRRKRSARGPSGWSRRGWSSGQRRRRDMGTMKESSVCSLLPAPIPRSNRQRCGRSAEGTKLARLARLRENTRWQAQNGNSRKPRTGCPRLFGRRSTRDLRPLRCMEGMRLWWFAAKQFARLPVRRESLVEFFRKSPLVGVDLDVTRSRDPGRSIGVPCVDPWEDQAD